MREVRTWCRHLRCQVGGRFLLEGAVDQKAIALAWHSGGYRHFIRSRHNATANDPGNAIDFFVNSSATAEGSSAPGTGNTNVMTLAGNGNVGIGGVTTPGSRLVVQGDGPVNKYQLVLQGATNPNKQLLFGYNTTDDYALIQPLVQGIGFRNLAINPSGGNVGIGTMSDQQFHGRHIS